jgi:glucose-specific phosphotransferase system IIA component
MPSRQAFFQRLATSLIIPISILPLAAVLLALGSQLGIAPLGAAGMALIQSWLPLFYGIGVSIGFTEGDAMGALSVTAGFLVMTAVAEAVSGDPRLNVGVLGGLIVGGACTWVYQRVKQVTLPEFLALFSGKRLGPIVAAGVGIGLGYLFGLFWPPIQGAIMTLGEWVTGAGGAGAFVYGASLRLLIPTGVHHLLLQLVDTQVGGWVDPVSGKLVAGEYLRFLAGDPQAGRILSGFFLTLGFGPFGAAMAIIHEARPEQRRKVAGLMTTGILTAMLLGITEPVEFAFIFASPVLFGLHVLLSGFASYISWALNIHLGGYALPMILINWHHQQNGWLLLPLGLLFTVIYYISFRGVIRWLHPPILGQMALSEAEPDPALAPVAPNSLSDALLVALGGAENLSSLDACMTRLRLVVKEPDRIDEGQLMHLGASRVLRLGRGEVQVVMGTRAGILADEMRGRLRQTASTERTLVICSPFTGRVVRLVDVPDPVFAEGLAGEGLAVEPSDGAIFAPVDGSVPHIFPGGHALGIVTPQGIEVLLHMGINTVDLAGQGFHLTITKGAAVQVGNQIGQVDLELLRQRGKSTVTPVLITNPESLVRLDQLASGTVRAGEPLMRLTLKS